MLDEIFMQILDMTKTASVVILVVIFARLLLKKAPKVFSYVLWLVVLFRLLCPVAIDTPVSIVPKVAPVSEAYELAEEPISIVGAGEAAYRAVSDVLNGGLGIQRIRTTESDEHGMSRYVHTDWWDVWILFGQYVWVAGIAVMVLHSVIVYLRLRKDLQVAVRLRDNIFIADDIHSPFVSGFIHPKIYLPGGLQDKEQEYIILHEQYHVKRLDPMVKALAFLALCIHWFNPLAWLAFVLACKDMEMSCDEAVIRKLGGDVRADYAASLLTLATGHRIIAGTPLAFGEGDTKGRIRNLASWKKPKIWIILAAVLACIVLWVCLMTNPASKDTMLMGAEYEIEEVLYDVTVGNEENVEPPLYYCVTADYHLYYAEDENEEWIYLGELTPYELTNQELKDYMPVDEMRRDADVSKITDAYILRVEEDNFYLVFQTKRGETYLAYGWEDVGERGDGASDDTRLRSLYRLESRFEDVERTGSFFDRSLVNGVGSDVDIYYTWTNADLPGYVIVGFLAGDAGFNEKTDMGFAVFYHNEDESAYILLDCQVYENAALAENGIYLCGDPAIADINGEMKPESTFDVVLVNNDNVAKVTRIYEYENGKTEAVSESFINTHNVALFSWEYDDAGCRVSQYFYDENGDMIDYSGEISGGVFDAYLYVPLEGEIIRYERTNMDIENVTKGQLLDTFTESAEPEDVDWEVFSVKEYPDHSVVLAAAGEDYEYLYRYSPSKRSDPDALQKAKDDGCVIVEDGDVTFGHQIWQDFVKATEEGREAAVLVAHYYTLDPERCSEEYYQAYKDDYPVLYVFGLIYDGSSYTMRWNESGEELVRNYKYLMHYTGDASTPNATYDSYIRYVLTNDDTVTWEDILQGTFSSQLGDYIDHYSIYTDLQ